MILEIIILVLVILNLVNIAVLAFLGKKNAFLIFAILEAILGFLFAYIVSYSIY